MNGFKFDMGARVRIAASGETGEVIGRAEYKTCSNSYYLRYKAADGGAVTAWWDEDALVAARE